MSHICDMMRILALPMSHPTRRKFYPGYYRDFDDIACTLEAYDLEQGGAK